MKLAALIIKYTLLTCAAAFAGVFAAVILSPSIKYTQNPEGLSGAVRYASFAASGSDATGPSSEIATSHEETPHNLSEAPETTLVLAEETTEIPSDTAAEVRFPTEGIFASVNEQVRRALVNIYCTRRGDGTLRTTVGSGVIISPQGVVLTNAHVAELFLLEGTTEAGTTRCFLRAGSPARNAYEAELLYIPTRWVEEFAPDLNAREARGTGEEDFALLLITNAADSDDDLPETFPYVPVNTAERAIAIDEQLIVGGYPALVGTLSSINKHLYLVSALSTVKKLYTFEEETLDLFSLNGTIASEHGVSGGAAANAQGELVGIIVTSTQAPTALERELRVLSSAYINRELRAETGETLSEFSNGNVRSIMRTFQEEELPVLTDLILKQNNP